MYLVLTDLLTCPRCGSGNGLIVLAERIVDRRILEGTLGCPICEGQYGILAGLADLRLTDAPSPDTDLESDATQDVDPTRIAALLGVTRGPAYALMLGPEARVAGEVAALVPGLEIIAIGSGVTRREEERGVSRVLVDGALPFRAGSLRAALIGTGVFEATARDAVRVVAIGARVVLALEHTWVEELITSGVLRVLARDAEQLVTVRLV